MPIIIDEAADQAKPRPAFRSTLRFGTIDEHNHTVNGYGPGVVRTELWEQLDKDLVLIGNSEQAGQSMGQPANNMILMKRYSYLENVANTTAILASYESDYITGQIFMIDGGRVMQ